MAKEKKSNVSSSSSSSRSTTKVSAPSPTSSIPSKESASPEKSPSKNKSETPPSPSQPPPSPPPPSPSNSPPPSPPPTSPPPSKPRAPPPSSPPPAKTSTPPPPSPSPPPPPTTTTLPPSSPPPPSSSSSPSPPLPPSSPPPSSSESPKIDSPPPSESPPSSQVTTPPSPGSFASPPSLQTPPTPPQSSSSPPPVSLGSYAKPTVPSSKSSGPSTSSTSSNNTPGQYVGFAFAALFALAFMVVILLMVLKKRDKRGNVYGIMPPPNKSQMKEGDVLYCVENPGFGSGTQEMHYSTRNHAGSVQHLGTPPPDVSAQQPVSAGQIVFTYDKIVEITDGFSEENVIGEGGFGRVYKASMPDGRVGAVKLLKAGSGQGEREFKAEVEIISRIHHRHLVSLLGYCISEQQRVLIYEFVPNGNLDQHLHEREKMVLDWPKRMKIAIGAARGLAYLHEGCNPKIIHRDIKSANILLDDDYEAQVADFGLARLTNDANTHVSTRVMGTFGYMAPEYATSGKLTDRSDVFSFGVVLLELVTGRKPVDPDQPVGDESLVEWARPLLLRAIGTGEFSELVDPRLEQYVDTEMFRMIEAAAACVRHSAPKRPSMVQIARALDSDKLYDLSNGVKYGQSTVYDSGQYNEEIRRFNGMDNISSFGDSDFDVYSREYNSRDMSEPIRIQTQSSSGDSEIRIFDGQGSNADSRL